MSTSAILVAKHYLGRYDNKNTREAYRHDLVSYFRWCRAHQIQPLSVTRAQLDLYASSLARTQLSAASRARKLSTVKGYYHIAQMDEVIEGNPAVFLRKVRVSKQSSRLGLTYLEFARVLDEAQKLSPSHHALVLLMGMMGLRVMEACEVRCEDFREERGHQVLSVMGKGQVPAVCPMPVSVWRVLEQVKAERGVGYLFLNQYGLPLRPPNARRMLNRVIRASAVEKKITPHSLRHTYITQLLDAGVPLRDVQIAARHADPRTTLRYDRGRVQLDKHANYLLAVRMASSS